MDVHDELRTRLRSASLVAAAIVVSLAIMLVFVELIRSQFKPFTGFAPPADAPVVRYAFYGAALAAVILARLLERTLLKPAPPDDPGTVLARLHRASLLTLALSEMPAILGFVLFLLGGFNVDFYALAFVSLFLVFMYYPRRSVWEERLRG